MNGKCERTSERESEIDTTRIDEFSSKGNQYAKQFSLHYVSFYIVGKFSADDFTFWPLLF